MQRGAIVMDSVQKDFQGETRMSSVQSKILKIESNLFHCCI